MARKGFKLEDLPAHIQQQVQTRMRAGESSPAAAEKTGRIRVSPKDQRTYDGELFASKWEMNAYKILCARVGKERITKQPVFLLQERTRDASDVWHRSIRYMADFMVGPPRNSESEPVKEGQLIIDAKGMRTRSFDDKRKMVAAKYGAVIHAPKNQSQLLEILRKYDTRANHQAG